MAEIDFDTDDALDEDADSDFDDVDDEGGASGSRRRLLIIGGIVFAVLLVVLAIFFFGFGGSSDKKDKAKQGQINTQAPQKVETVTQKKKKRKKVKYARLYELPSASVPEVLRELSYAGILFTTEQRGGGRTMLISVDADRVDEARNLLAVRGLPSGSAKGYALLDQKQTLGVTEFDKRVRFIRALSGELEKAIMQFDAVESAKVQIVLPEQRLFAVTQPPVTASILIRRSKGYEISDDIVFSIIQLVSGAVENLQLENVSVIDTEGTVLSNGLFERMALREAGLLDESQQDEIEEDRPGTTQQTAVGQPVIPDFESITKWFEVKTKYERNLEKLVLKQLIGILPAGSFKVAITSELGPLDGGEVVDVRLLKTSIVVDSNNEDIYLDPPLKQQIFQTVAATIGYVRERGDQILLTLADFSLLSDKEKKELASVRRNAALMRWVRLFLPYVAIPVAVGLVWFGYSRIWRRRGEKDSVVDGQNQDTDFSDLQDEMLQERKKDQVREVAVSNPEALAQLMEQWLSEQAAEDGGE